MSIAQQEVAGEGAAHPEANTPSLMALDHQALTEFECDNTNLPWLTFRAAFRASHIDALPARARSLLAALARTVLSNRPYAAIYARRDLLTGRAMQSMRTFYRSLDDLEAAGMIRREPQKRSEAEGVYGRAYLHLTEKAAVLLGFVEPPPAIPAASSLQPGSEHPVRQESPTPPSATLADGSIYKDVYPTSFQKRQPGSLPSDLERLTSLGFNKFFVFKLMAEARSHGKRLSDVVECCWHALKKAVAPIAYLRSLLQRPVDFAYQARQRRVEAQTKVHADRAHAELLQTLHSVAGKTFSDPATGVVIEIGEQGTSALVRHPDEPRPRSAVGNRMFEFARAIRTGRLELLGTTAPAPSILAPHVSDHPPAGDRQRSDTNTSRQHVLQMREMLKGHRRAMLAG